MTSIAIELPPIVGAVPPASPLSVQQLNELEGARVRQKKIRRAVVVAKSDAWLTAIFGGLTLLTGIFSVVSIVLGVALCGIAWNAFRGAEMLRKLDERGPRRLAVNQLVLAGILGSYAVYCLLTASAGTSELHRALGNEPQVAAMLGSIDKLVWMVTVLVYGGLIVGTVIAQGLAAWYYASRRKILRAYKESTPEWIQQVQMRV